MKIASRSSGAGIGLATIVLLQAACQQGATPGSTNNISETNSVNASASAAPAPSAPAAPDPAIATGPVALATDASLPAICQEFVRATQSCLDNLPEDADRASREQNLRSALQRGRVSWAGAADDTYRTAICGTDLAALQAGEPVFYQCRPR